MNDTDADRADRFASARSGAEALDALLDCFGPGAEIFVLDHAAATLNSCRGGADVELDDTMRRDLFSLRPSRDGDRWWVPLPERDQPIFVVSAPGDAEPRHLTPGSIGVLMAYLRQRFETIEKTRRRAQMSVAAEFQWDLLPVRADNGCGSSIAAVLEPAYDVAGDLFDHSFDESTWVYSFDGMGHGLGATTHASAALAAVRNRRRRGDGLTDQFAEASRAVREVSRGGAFVTAVGCAVSVDGDVRIVNAGHEPVRLIRGREVTALEIPADLPLGVGEGPTYREHRLDRLGAGDGLVLMSDGAADARTPEGGRLGAERIDEIIASAWSDVPLRSAHRIAGDILDETVDQIADDITVVVVRRDGRVSVGPSR